MPDDVAPLELFVDEPLPGPWNMAVDEALLERGDQQGIGSLRLYRWSEPTLSLGYFQTWASRTEHVPSRQCTTVRRLSGGGAILHDREWTYSLVLPKRHPQARDPLRLYHLVHDGLIELLSTYGITAAKVSAASGIATQPEPFLCFERRAAGDVVLPEAKIKILGSAQRRRRGTVLQHGSLLLERSPAAPNLEGVWDVGRWPAGVSYDEIGQKWVAKFAQSFKITTLTVAVPDEVRVRAQHLLGERYRTQAWNFRR